MTKATESERVEDGFAVRLERLFETVRPAPDRMFSNADIAEATGGRFSSTTVWQLRTGRTRNPKLETVVAIAQAFHVAPTYFLESETTTATDDELRVQAALRRPGFHDVLAQAATLSDRGLEALPAAIDLIASLDRDPKDTTS